MYKGPEAQRIVKVFNEFNKDKLNLLDSFYSNDVTFIDPVVKVSGLSQLKTYYSEAYKNVVSIKFDFHKVDYTGDTYFAEWTMSLQVRALNGGKPFPVKGLSEIKFNEKNLVVYHRDYLDLGSMVYEKIPVIGKAIKLIKKNLTHGLASSTESVD